MDTEEPYEDGNGNLWMSLQAYEKLEAQKDRAIFYFQWYYRTVGALEDWSRKGTQNGIDKIMKIIEEGERDQL